MNTPKFSIIIPVYNVENYLRKCLDSIVAQTFNDFEVICINDGSTDNSLAILNEYANKDSRFKVISQINQGQGVARNNGIELARGEYLGFVDPDDWVETNLLEEVLKKSLEANADIIEFNFYEVYEADFREKLHKRRVSVKENVVFDFRIDKKYLFGNDLMVWNKFFKLDFIKRNGIKFAKSKRSEDTIFSIKSLVFAEKITYLNRPMYHYLIRKNSSVNSISLENLKVVDCFFEVKEFLCESNLFSTYKKEFYNNSLKTFYQAYMSLPKENQAEFLNATEAFFGSEKYSKYVKNGKKSFMQRIFSVENVYELGRKIAKRITIFGFNFHLAVEGKGRNA